MTRARPSRKNRSVRKSTSRKSTSRRPRRSSLGRPYKPERGCTNQSRFKKYASRRSPPYPANLCRGLYQKGNDGKRYKSELRGRSKAYRWFLQDN
jgi:hypothetical protein